MSDREYLETWTNNFFSYLNINNSDLVSLFAGRIMFTEESKPGYFKLDDRYATANQIERMDNVFNEYCKNNPI